MVGSTELAPEAPVHREEAGVTIELAALGVPFGPISPCTGFSGLIRSPVAIDRAHANDGLYLMCIVWCVVCGVWCLVYGVWRMAYDVWRMAYGVWRVVGDGW